MIEEIELTVEGMNEKLFEYLKVCNFLRLHQSLDYRTFVDKLEDYIKSHQGVHHVVNLQHNLAHILEKKYNYHMRKTKMRF
jgi:hypothetical protein